MLFYIAYEYVLHILYSDYECQNFEAAITMIKGVL